MERLNRRAVEKANRATGRRQAAAEAHAERATAHTEVFWTLSFGRLPFGCYQTCTLCLRKANDLFQGKMLCGRHSKQLEAVFNSAPRLSYRTRMLLESAARNLRKASRLEPRNVGVLKNLLEIDSLRSRVIEQSSKPIHLAP